MLVTFAASASADDIFATICAQTFPIFDAHSQMESSITSVKTNHQVTTMLHNHEHHLPSSRRLYSYVACRGVSHDDNNNNNNDKDDDAA